MLLSFGHGQRIVIPSDGGLESNIIPYASKRMSQVAPGALMAGAPESGVGGGGGMPAMQKFGYMFLNADGVAGTDAATVDALKALAAAMTEAPGDPATANSDIAPIFTYLGQFIDHDITANTDRDDKTTNTTMTGDVIVPLPRADVEDSLVNLRNGTLRLDSLYGEGPADTPFTMKMRAAMRDPNDAAKMRLGTLHLGTPGEKPPLPVDGFADLPRLGDVIDDPASGLTEDDIFGLPDDMRRDFVEFDPNTNTFVIDPGTGKEIIKRSLAVIGDMRNDENLLVAQLHLAFLRFHNAVADDLAATIPDAEARFAEARKRVTHIYQWLVANVYLPKVCMPSVVDAVKVAGAPLYKDFHARVGSPGSELPLPLEFSVAAFRFGHSMVRAAYDHNRNFGRPGNLLPQATFAQLFSFTGGDKLGMTAINQAHERLPDNWPIEWDRFAPDVPNEPDHRARKIDTKLAPPLENMEKEDDGLSDADKAGELGRILRHLAERNLRRSHRLNIPSGQAVTEAINAFDSGGGAFVESGAYKVAYDGDDIVIPEPPSGIAVLSEDVLSQGPAGQALSDGDMLQNTPLWYYLLREAEETAGDPLGPLGSRLVAETLMGLIIEDSTSYWHNGAGNGAWSPSEVPVGGMAITDFPKMLASCDLMA